MERINPILIFRCTPDVPEATALQVYSIKTGMHQIVLDNSPSGIEHNFYTNSIITRSREATDATEYSE